MMQIVYFSEKAQLWEELGKFEKNLTLVTPSPAKADALRSHLEIPEVDVLTIAKFTSNLIEALELKETISLKRKSELYLIFGILKNKHLPELGFEQFTQAYNLFSDLRSFTLDLEALSSVLEEQPEEIRKAVGLFWQILELTQFVDEHGAYQKITEALRSADDVEALRKTYVFWGFQHLNGQQVDLLKALAIRYDVIIPFPAALQGHIRKTDWISWIQDTRATVSELPATEKKPKAGVRTVNSRELALTLKDLLREGDQVVLGVSRLTPSHLDLLPVTGVNVKIPHQLISSELKEIHHALKGKTFDSLEALKTALVEIVPRNLKQMKALQLYQEALTDIRELSDETFNVESFFLKILHEVVSLNQPRSSYVVTSPAETSVDFGDMSSLEGISRKKRVLICVDERFEDIQGLGQNYTESIQKALSVLGPVKRNELDLRFRHWEFHDLCAHAEVIILLSPSILKNSLIWKRLLAGLELYPVEEKSLRPEKKILDHLRKHPRKSFAGSFSASKFQAFMDCPRKFYFTYVDQLFPSLQLKQDFDPLTSGTISHEIIERYHKEKLSLPQLPGLVTKITQHYIEETNVDLSREARLQKELIFRQRSTNGILFLEKLKELLGEIEWKMEEGFALQEDFELRGKIDCIGLGKDFLLLLDFKSTKYSASSSSEVEELESLQLWTYARAATKLIPDFATRKLILGFVVLDNPSESNFLMSDEELFDQFKTARICKQKKTKEDIHVLLRSAEQKMITLSVAIAAEKEFAAKPRKPGACDYCELSKVCIKAEVLHG